MLALRPNCEYCDRDLPPDSPDARICSYECTFCADCVETVLFDVCPNCGGGFVPRPIRPSTERRPGVSLARQPASDERVRLKYGRSEVAAFVRAVRDIPPQAGSASRRAPAISPTGRDESSRAARAAAE
ncbi:hypothetical protein SAMN06297382_1293 [Amphiplicatus metriothermophilus]|uniref:Urease-associated protein n=1 Tax=Amphiplicatus metriothermophilus TaxID=1519374 RepID=A0A239PPQ6_9PROT|nr:hypothetical protein [Amphiplicatus metriothermophilus]SNT72255.1 hypothetical protein SAMN06297382_1293 [Amphiplicatus metriothermophilus]